MSREPREKEYTVYLLDGRRKRVKGYSIGDVTTNKLRINSSQVDYYFPFYHDEFVWDAVEQRWKDEEVFPILRCNTD